MKFIPVILLSLCFIAMNCDNASKVVAFLKKHVGDGYCWGGAGERMSEKVLQQFLKRFDKDHVKPDKQRAKNMGKLVYDCSGLVMKAFNEVGINIVHHADSAWKGTRWAQKGDIGGYPKNKVCILYKKSGNTMVHTGVYIGGGQCIHAKGTDYGVVKEGMPGTWTHYGIPKGLY